MKRIRRSSETIQQLRAILWDVVRFKYYAQFQCCDDCGEPAYCAGKRKDKLRCRPCHMLHADV